MENLLINSSISTSISRWTCSKASPFKLDPLIVLRKYVFRWGRTKIDHSQVHVVTDNVARICNDVYMLGNDILSINGRRSDKVAGGTPSTFLQ